MANTDLREMRAGRMDRKGEGMTNAGRILGMVATFLMGLALVFLLVLGLSNVQVIRYR